MNERIALAYSGSLASTAAIAWLRERHDAEVVTVTLDVGQIGDLDEVRARALASGAARAHVLDTRDTFARDYVIPALQDAARRGEAAPAAALAEPLVARMLVELAAIEAAGAVAHASSGASLGRAIAQVDPTLRTIAPAHEWAMNEAELLAYARAHALPVTTVRRERHLLIRRAVDPARTAGTEAHVEIAFERGLPVALNGVPMTLPELIDSVSLIAGQHGVGFGDPLPAPAGIILHAAYAAVPRPDGSVRIRLHDGAFEVLLPVNSL